MDREHEHVLTVVLVENTPVHLSPCKTQFPEPAHSVLYHFCLPCFNPYSAFSSLRMKALRSTN